MRVRRSAALGHDGRPSNIAQGVTTWLTVSASASSWRRSTKPGRTRRWRWNGTSTSIAHLDRLGWDEAWIGEHHSAGTEIIASPEIFIAAAAERTRHIKLGTGVISVAYHNPYMVAERAVLLDHLTRGRFMLGLGPGSLPTDAIMLGLDPTETRPLLEEGVDVIMKLLRTEEPVTSQTKTWNLVDARLHLRPYSKPLFDVAVPAVASPSGPRLAGRYGIGLLSIGATQAAGFDALGLHWDVMEERAETLRHRRRPIAVAPRRADAHRRDQGAGRTRTSSTASRQWFDYFQHTAAFPQMDVGAADAVREMIDFVNDSRSRLDRHRRHGRASRSSGCRSSPAASAATCAWPTSGPTRRRRKRSYELIAQRVFPEFQGHGRARTGRSRERGPGRP